MEGDIPSRLGCSASFNLTTSQHFYDDDDDDDYDDDVWASVPKAYDKNQVKRKPNPQDNANWLSALTFWWFNWIVYTGYKRPLEDKDLWALSRKSQASYIVPRLRKKWIEQERKCKELNTPKQTRGADGEAYLEDDGYQETDRLLGDKVVSGKDYTGNSSVLRTNQQQKQKNKKKEKKPSLIRTFWSGLFGKNFAIAVLCRLTQIGLIFLHPQLIRLLVEYIENKSDWFGEWKEWKGYTYCGSMFVTACIQTLLFEHSIHIMMTIGMRVHTAIIGLVYEKALLLSSKSRGQSTAGELVNLMSVDAMHIMQTTNYINSLWSSPIQFGVALFFLYNTLGISTLAGLGVMLLIVPLNWLIVDRIVALQAKQMAEKDERIKMMNEVLTGIKVLKLYSWEESFIKAIKQIRNKEVKIIRNSSIWYAAINFIFGCAPTLVAVITFAVYCLTGNELTASKAFVALTLFNVMRTPLLAFPDTIVGCARAGVSIKRIQKFLDLEELDPDNVHKRKLSSSAVTIENGSFYWSSKDAPVLRKVSLSIPHGSLVAIVGQVGCGKSTLLSAVLGETEKLHGKVFLEGTVAYVSQQAWIQNATLRENILFSRPLDSARYERVIDACALRPDLEILPAGDSTEIGERGINLSGGQKQRVSLARAVYFDADVYLLDDPLSAVDTHVGKHIFDNVVGPRGMLRNKTRLLATHGIHFLPQVDQIVVIKDGKISECGTYSELRANSGAFAEFLQTYASEHHESANLQAKLVRSSRKDSTRFTTSVDAKEVQLAEKANEREKGKMIDEERSETGKVKLSVFLSYLKSMGMCVTITSMIFFFLMEACTVGTGVWLAYWSSANITTKKQRDFYIGIYGGIGLGEALFTFLVILTIQIGSMLASRRLHHRLLDSIMHSPMCFFDTTPLGRIVNRFSKDMDAIDVLLKRYLQEFVWSAFDILGMIVAISYATPLFLVVLPPLGVLYFYIQRVYVATSRQLKRIESVRRSPIYSHFLETINGTTTIRAFSQQKHFIRDNYDRTDENQVAHYLAISSARWIGIRLEFLGNIFVLFAGLFAVICRHNTTSGLVGMSLTYSLLGTDRLNWLVRMASLLETELVAVERVKEYSETSSEVRSRV